MPVGRDEVGGPRIEGIAVHACNASARFLDDQRAGRDVPWLQVLLPERLEPARRHIAQVERGGPETAYRARAPEEVSEQGDQLAAFFVHVVGKARDQQRVDEGSRL